MTGLLYRTYRQYITWYIGDDTIIHNAKDIRQEAYNQQKNGRTICDSIRPHYKIDIIYIYLAKIDSKTSNVDI